MVAAGKLGSPIRSSSTLIASLPRWDLRFFALDKKRVISSNDTWQKPELKRTRCFMQILPQINSPKK